MMGKRIKKDRVDIATTVRYLVKCKYEYFEADKDGFHNLLTQKMGTSKDNLMYAIRDRVFPVVFPDVATEQMFL